MWVLCVLSTHPLGMLLIPKNNIILTMRNVTRICTRNCMGTPFISEMIKFLENIIKICCLQTWLSLETLTLG